MGPPCAACKVRRRRCTDDCVLAPYFPSNHIQRFTDAHKIFGASKISKMIQGIPLEKRGDAVNSMVYEATARVKDPVYGCVGAVRNLQRHVLQLKSELHAIKKDLKILQEHQKQQPQQQQQYYLQNSLKSICDVKKEDMMCHFENITPQEVDVQLDDFLLFKDLSEDNGDQSIFWEGLWNLFD